MELHEGKISVFSEGEGYGATFTVELPAYDQEALSGPTRFEPYRHSMSAT